MTTNRSARSRLVSTIGALFTCTVLLTAALVVLSPAQAAESATGSIPTCGASGNNCLIAPGTEGLVAAPTDQTPGGVVNGPGIDFDFSWATVGQGPACPADGFSRDDVPCQAAASVFYRLYDPSKPPSDSQGGLTHTTKSCTPDFLSCLDTLTVYPNPIGYPHFPDNGGTSGEVTVIATVDYLQAYADDPNLPQHFTTKGQDYQVVLHLLPEPPPTAPVAISISPDRDVVAPGKDTTVDVVLTSTGPGQSATVTLDPALESRDGLFEITPPAGADGPHTVPAGGSKTITFTVHAGDTLGLDELRAEGEAVDAHGLSWPLSTTHDLEVAEHTIDAAITFDPAEITLAEDADGPKPETITMHAEVTNVSATELTDVALLLGKPGWQKVNPASAYVPSDVVALKTPVTDDEYALDDIAPGETTAIDIPVIVKDDGHIEWGGLIRYTRDGKEKVEPADPGKLTSIPKYLTRFQLKPWPASGQIVDASIDDLPGGIEPWNGPQIVKAGNSFGLFGEVENRTTDQVVMAELPTTDLQNITSAVFRGVSSAGAGDQYAAGLPYRETIDPGSTQVVGSFPSTVENETFGPGETFSSRLTIVPKAAAPNEDGSYPDAVIAKVLTIGDLTASAATETPPVLPGPNVDESYLGRLAIGYTEGGIKFVKGTSATIDWVLAKIPELPAMSAQAASAFLNVGSRLVNGLVAVGTELSEMSPAELASFTASLAEDALRFIFIKTPDAGVAVTAAVYDMVGKLTEKLISAVFYAEDPGAFWQSLGSFISQAIGELSVGWLTDTAIAKVLVGLKDARGFLKAEQFLSEQAAAVGLKLEKGLAGIKPGTLITDRMLALGMGITKAQKDYMIAVARKWGVNIYARSRGAKAIELIEKGLATAKPYFIKPKSVNDIDKLFLGFEKLESDVVAMRRPNSWETVSSKMDGFVDPATGQGLTAEQRDLVVDRWQKRNKEWFGDKGKPGVNPVENEANFAQSDRYKLQQKSGKTQNLTLETEGNLEDEFKGKAFQVKPTKFQLVASDADPEALIPQLFEGTWKSIVGDVDLVAITFPNGQVPDIKTLIKIYEDLQLPPLNMQHSATLTWLNETAAATMLKDHLGAAAEPLIEVAAGSSRMRAVLFDPKMSFANGDYYKLAAQFVHLAGGEINAPRAWGIGGAIVTVTTNEAHQEYTPPSVFPADMSRTAPPTRLGPNGLETLVNGVWVPNPAPSGQSHATAAQAVAALGASEAAEARTVVGVQTALHETVLAGSTVLPVLSLAELYPDGTAGEGWFQAGDEVIVDPGTAAAFRTRLVAVGDTLVLADPLPTDVLLGTMVAMVPEVVASTNPGDGAGAGGSPAAPTPPGVASTELARTGVSIGRELQLAIALLLLGLAVNLARRRGRPTLPVDRARGAGR